MSDLASQLQELSGQVQRYFGQLNEAETYGWIAEGTGFLLFVIGVVLFFL